MHYDEAASFNNHGFPSFFESMHILFSLFWFYCCKLMVKKTPEPNRYDMYIVSLSSLLCTVCRVCCAYCVLCLLRVVCCVVYVYVVHVSYVLCMFMLCRTCCVDETAYLLCVLRQSGVSRAQKKKRKKKFSIQEKTL